MGGRVRLDQGRPPRKRRKEELDCLLCSSSAGRRKAPCDGGYPCSECARNDNACSYPSPPPFSSPWTTADPSVVEHYPEPLYLSQGTTGAGRLNGRRSRSGGVTHFEFERAVDEREDLRIRPHPLFPPCEVFPPTLSAEKEAETFDREGDELLFAGDKQLLANAYDVLPTPLHPTILLNSLLADRPPTSRIATTFEPTNLNYGNCLSIANIPGAESTQAASLAVWRTADNSGRPTTVALGRFTAGPKFIARRATTDDRSSSPDDSSTPRPARTSYAHLFPRLTPFLLDSLQPCSSPILQLSLAPLASPTALLAVRNHTSLILHQLSPTSNSKPILATFEYPSSSLGRRTIADVVLGGVSGGEQGAGMVVDVRGTLWGWGLGVRGSGRFGSEDWKGGRVEMFELRKGVGSGEMARVVYGGMRGEDAVVAREDRVLIYDLRSPRASTLLVDQDMLSRGIPLGPNQSPSLITSLRTPSPSTHLFSASLEPSTTPTALHIVCTTRDVIWLDERMPGKDLMRWAHGRVGKKGKGVDRTLSLTQVASGSLEVSSHEGTTERVALHSRVHPLITIHTYSSHATSPPRSLLDPYSLPSPTEKPWIRTGLFIVPARATVDKVREEEGWVVLESGADGSVRERYVGMREYEEGEGVPEEGRRVWSKAVRGLEVQRGEEGGAKARRFNIGEAVKKAFGAEDEEEEEEKEVVERVAERLEKARNAWRVMGELGSDEVDGVGTLTAFDLLNLDPSPQGDGDEDDMDVDEKPAFALTPLPRPSSFLDASAASVRNTPLKLSGLLLEAATSDLEGDSAWARNLFDGGNAGATSLRGKFASDLATSWTSMRAESKRLQKLYSVPTSGERTSMDRLAAEACDQVVLDSMLASHVYSLRPVVPNPAPPLDAINQPHPPDRDPPALPFSYFHPRLQRPNHDDDNWKKPSLASVGVRMLLSEWHCGSQPSSYAWSNPYTADAKDAVDDEASQAPGRKGKKKRDRHLEPPSSQAFPFASSQPARHIDRIVEEEDPASQSQSQDAIMWASQPLAPTTGGMSFEPPSNSPFHGASQVVPGAFGGRLGGKEKEKPKKKKRAAGF